MDQKYELTGTWQVVDRYTLYRIRAVKDFSDVKAGDLGGWIESEDNLSHEGDCWVYEDAWVWCGARVYGNARVSGAAEVLGCAQIYGNAMVCKNARILENVHIFGNAHVSGKTQLDGTARISGDAWISTDLWSGMWRNIKIDHGVWIQWITIDGKYYLISSTLEKAP